MILAGFRLANKRHFAIMKEATLVLKISTSLINYEQSRVRT